MLVLNKLHSQPLRSRSSFPQVAEMTSIINTYFSDEPVLKQSIQVRQLITLARIFDRAAANCIEGFIADFIKRNFSRRDQGSGNIAPQD